MRSQSVHVIRHRHCADARGSNRGLWWKFPPGSESGWGINFAHQGDILFATWFTYDTDRKPLWPAAVLNLVAPGVYAGDAFTTTGPLFSAVPFDGTTVVETVVGTMSVTLTDDDNGRIDYTIDTLPVGPAAVAQSKPITRHKFADPVPLCAWGAEGALSLAENYQDLWWASPPGSESGWGVNFTQQGDIIFFTWYTYGADGNHATFAYTVNGIAQTKQTVRQVFVEPGTICY